MEGMTVEQRTAQANTIRAECDCDTCDILAELVEDGFIETNITDGKRWYRKQPN
jgi:hypothetical protein